MLGSCGLGGGEFARCRFVREREGEGGEDGAAVLRVELGVHVDATVVNGNDRSNLSKSIGKSVTFSIVPVVTRFMRGESGVSTHESELLSS